MKNILWSDYSHHFAKKHLVAAFTNSNFPYSRSIDRLEFAKSLELDYHNIIEPSQVHSNNVEICTKSGVVENTDGVITRNRELVLSIQVADCIPVYIFDKQNHNFGLVHAGWRGVQSGIVENSIEKMLQLNSDSKDIKILLGPSIRQCCFEVGPEVGNIFDTKFQYNGKADRTQLDLQGVVFSKLIENGIMRNKIIDVEECTCCSNKYHSFRRDGEKAGRMIAMIGWKNKKLSRNI